MIIVMYFAYICISKTLDFQHWHCIFVSYLQYRDSIQKSREVKILSVLSSAIHFTFWVIGLKKYLELFGKHILNFISVMFFLVH